MKLGFSWFSDAHQLARRKVDEARWKAEEKAEAAKLADICKRIKEAPPKSGEELTKDMNETMKKLGVVALAVLLLAGCATWRPVPTRLVFPKAPEISFHLEGDIICIDQSEGRDLSRWLKELNAFRDAWERLK